MKQIAEIKAAVARRSAKATGTSKSSETLLGQAALGKNKQFPIELVFLH